MRIARWSTAVCVVALALGGAVRVAAARPDPQQGGGGAGAGAGAGAGEGAGEGMGNVPGSTTKPGEYPGGTDGGGQRVAPDAASEDARNGGVSVPLELDDASPLP